MLWKRFLHDGVESTTGRGCSQRDNSVDMLGPSKKLLRQVLLLRDTIANNNGIQEPNLGIVTKYLALKRIQTLYAGGGTGVQTRNGNDPFSGQYLGQSVCGQLGTGLLVVQDISDVVVGNPEITPEYDHR